MTQSISCTIITLNEGDRLAATLQSIAEIADEIVVVDSGSSDDTVVVAKGFGARVVHNDWPGYGPQKRFAEDQAAHDWILNLDADEVLTPQLQSEIIAWKQQEQPDCSGYRFRQVTIYPGKEGPRPFADYHDYIRLYDRRVMRFRESIVHDTVDDGGEPVGRFKGECWHWSWRSLDHLAKKLDGYTTLQAQELRKPLWQLRLRQPIEYPLLLARYLIAKRHITGGTYGIKAAHVLARERAKRISKIRAAQQGSSDNADVT